MSRKIDFADVPPPPRHAAVGQVGSLAFVAVTKSGVVPLDFSSLRGTPLERRIVESFRDSLGALRVANGQVLRTCRDVHNLCRFLERTYPDVRSVRQLSGQILDEWVNGVMPKGPASGWGPYETCMDVFAVLKNLDDGALSSDAVSRIQYVHADGKPPENVKDAYSDFVVKQIEGACRKRIPEIVQRLTVDAAKLIADGKDPRGLDASDWEPLANRAWLLNELGPVAYQEKIAGCLDRTAARSMEIYSAIFASEIDLIPFFLLFVVDCGWPVAVNLDMSDDCRSNITIDHITLTSIKYRAGHKIVSDRFRNSGLFSAGGLIAQVIAIGERLRKVAGKHDLWLAYCAHSIRRMSFGSVTRNYLSKFLGEIDLREEDGTPIRTLELIRLRKAHKTRWYRKTLGQLDRFARNEHTIPVAAQRYGNIPALLELHETTIAEGQQAALDAAIRINVCSAETPKEAASEIGLSPEEVAEIYSGSKDMWLSACRNPYDSPFGPAGKACRVRPGFCLACTHAVIVGRHLPRVLAFRQWLLRQRNEMSEGAWNSLHGAAWLSIEREVLPRFPKVMLAQASAIASVDHGVPLLPPEIILQGLLA